MDPSSLAGANKQRLRWILSQAELRLDAQLDFARAADQRASTLSGAAAAMAAAATAVFAQAIESGKASPLAVAGIVAAIGFSSSTYFAIRSAKCHDFHPPGYRPVDFIDDVQTARAEEAILRDIACGLNSRLAFNSDRLSERGALADKAINIMAATPVLALLLSVAYALVF